MSDYDLHVQ